MNPRAPPACPVRYRVNRMHKFDEMYVQLPYGGADTVRAHYQAYAAWLARQPAGTWRRDATKRR